MSTLETQYRNYLKENPDSGFTFEEWSDWKFSNIELPSPHNSLRPLDEHLEELSDWDVTLNDGLENVPQMISRKMGAQQELINLLYSQVVDLSMMSKIELGDDVIAEIKRLNEIING
jgi:hypothetical protein